VTGPRIFERAFYSEADRAAKASTLDHGSSFLMWRPTFDMSGMPRLAGACPLDGGVSPGFENSFTDGLLCEHFERSSKRARLLMVCVSLDSNYRLALWPIMFMNGRAERNPAANTTD
jgi:hypothetical protein